jgi:hypothetical protein
MQVGPVRLSHGSVLCLLALCALRLPTAASGQANPASRDLDRWAVAVYLGSASGGPAPDLEAAMTASGYTDPFGGCTPFFGCVPESPSPSSYSHANPWLLSIRYRARGAYGTELLLGQSSSGRTSGNRQSERLSIEYGGTILAPLAAAGTRHLRLGMGPALLRGNWNYRDSGDGSQEQLTTHTFGWIGNAALGVPLWSRFELGVTGQYRSFGRTTVGPSPSTSPSLAAATVRTTHWYAAGGIGLTF